MDRDHDKTVNRDFKRHWMKIIQRALIVISCVTHLHIEWTQIMATNIILRAVGLVGLAFSINLYAATYYIDSVRGNDTWSGTQPIASQTDGPWQSLAKVNAIVLMPGDKVLLACNQTWMDTLRPMGDGNPANPITIGTYPAICSNKPQISGFQRFPSFAWEPYKGNIWKAKRSFNQIENGDFSTPLNVWRRYPADTQLAVASTSCKPSFVNCLSIQASTLATSIAISNTFPLIQGKHYSVTMTFNAAPGVVLGLIARKHGDDYANLGLSQDGIVSNGGWQSVSFEFVANRTWPTARLEISLPKGSNALVQQAWVNQIFAPQTPVFVLMDGDPANIAHHPNVGYDNLHPDSPYFLSTAASSTVTLPNGGLGSSEILVGDLKLPQGAIVTPGTKLTIRNLDYQILERTVTSLNLNHLNFSPATNYPLISAGRGFFLSNQLWMLDSPGEWFYDQASDSFYIWSTDSLSPGSRVEFSNMDVAINLANRSNYVVNGLAISGASTGVDGTNSTSLALQFLDVTNSSVQAILAAGAINPSFSSSKISRSGGMGVYAENSRGMLLTNNQLSEIGVFIKNGQINSLPPAYNSAIVAGANAQIVHNIVSDVAGYGVQARTNNFISENIIQRFCRQLDDCSAIYTSSVSAGSSALNNLMRDGSGNRNGTPNVEHTSGIYMDDGVSGIIATGNTIIDTTYGIHFHNASLASARTNTFYGQRKSALWLQEDSQRLRPGGDLVGNSILTNLFFPTLPVAPISLSTTISDVTHFASFNYNQYSIAFNPYVAGESVVNQQRVYTFGDWRSATGTGGVLRNIETNGQLAAPLTRYAPGIIGTSFLTNSNFSSGMAGWGTYNAVVPVATKALEPCAPVASNCLHVTAGGSATLLNSPKFPITQNNYYRVTFDLKSTTPSMVLQAIVRFSGPQRYTNLMTIPYTLTATNVWTRFSVLFKATDTANNTQAPDQSARLDIQGIVPGQSVWIANAEVNPVNIPAAIQPSSFILVNDTYSASSADCPVRSTNPLLCTNMVTFPEGVPVQWPIQLPGPGTKIVYSQNLSVLDSDGDGVADSQDICPGTQSGKIANAVGCSL